MKYFIYCRRSSDREDKQCLSIEAQQRNLEAYAKRNGLKIVDRFAEDKSAYKPNIRPQFSEMLQRLEDGEADAILTYHLSRLARNALDGGRIIQMFDEDIIKEIRTPQHSYYKHDTFIMAIEFAVTKKSSDDTSLFVKRDIESKLLKGEYPSCAPIGYLNITKEGQISPNQYVSEKWKRLEASGRKLKRVELDPIEAPLVKRVFEEAAKGTASLRKLADFATGLGLRTRRGERVSKTTVHSMLRNPFYCGHIRHKGKLYTEDIQHEPIVDVALFNRVQQMIGTRGKSQQKRRNFAYTGLIKCAECSCAITAETQRGIIYYHCTHNKGPCSQRTWMREEHLEERLQDALVGLVIPRTFLKVAFTKARELHAEETQTQDVRMHELKRRLTLCTDKINKLMEWRLSPSNVEGAELSNSEYASMKQKLEKQKCEIEEQIRDCENRSANWLEDCERFIEWTQELHKKLPLATIEQKKDLLSLICSNMNLRDQKLVVVYAEPFASIVQFSKTDSDRFERKEPFSEKEDDDLTDRWRG